MRGFSWAIANHPALSLDVASDNGNREVNLTRLPLGRTMGLPRAWEARQGHTNLGGGGWGASALQSFY